MNSAHIRTSGTLTGQLQRTDTRGVFEDMAENFLKLKYIKLQILEAQVVQNSYNVHHRQLRKTQKL